VRGCCVKRSDQAQAAGGLLLEAMAGVMHGTWLPWLQENFDGSARMAQVYMQLARDRFFLAVNTQRVAHLSMRGAVQVLVEPPKGVPPIRDRNIPETKPEPVAEAEEA
jgi:hypothetical protein